MKQKRMTFCSLCRSWVEFWTMLDMYGSAQSKTSIYPKLPFPTAIEKTVAPPQCSTNSSPRLNVCTLRMCSEFWCPTTAQVNTWEATRPLALWLVSWTWTYTTVLKFRDRSSTCHYIKNRAMIWKGSSIKTTLPRVPSSRLIAWMFY